jgi:hypothetical protein
MGECKLKNVMFSTSTFQEIKILLSLSKKWPIPMGRMAEGSFSTDVSDLKGTIIYTYGIQEAQHLN